MDVIRAEGLVKQHGNGESRRVALAGVDLSVTAGEFVAVVGPSGSGKTTLLQLLAAMDTPTSGRVFFEDRSLASMDESERTDLRRDAVGFVFQEFNLLPALQTWENVALPMLLARRPVKQRRGRAMALLEAVGLVERASAMPLELSGGEQQRVALARALVNEPRLLLADEPTGSLDTQTGLDVMGLFDRIRRERGCAIVAVTHDLRMASGADRIVRLRDGAVVDIHVPEPGPVADLDDAMCELA